MSTMNQIDLFNVSDDVKRKEYVSIKYTGVLPYRVIAVNPNHEQLKHILNNDNVTEPKYVNIEMGGKFYNRLTFYLKSQECTDDEGNEVPAQIIPLTFNLANRDEEASSSGKYKILNNHNQSMYSTSVETLVAATGAKTGKRYFSENGARIAKVGEIELCNFIIKYLNIDVTWSVDKDKSNFVDFRPIFDKVVTLSPEGLQYLRNMFETAAGKAGGVKILTGIRTTPEGKEYYSLFTKQFLNIEQSFSAYKRLGEEALVKDGDSVTYDWGAKNCYQDSLLIKKWNPEYLAKLASSNSSNSTNTQAAPSVTNYFS